MEYRFKVWDWVKVKKGEGLPPWYDGGDEGVVIYDDGGDFNNDAPFFVRFRTGAAWANGSSLELVDNRQLIEEKE